LGVFSVPLHSVHTVGYGFGAALDWRFWRFLQTHFSFSTGFVHSSGFSKAAGPTVLSVSRGGSIGFYSFNLGLLAVLPKIWLIEPAIGGGLNAYRLGTAAFSFNTVFSPVIIASLHFQVSTRLAIGLTGNLMFPYPGRFNVGSTEHTLNGSQNLSVLSWMLCARWQF
jgi:hypothetical protein